jgi:hypothetical protein
MSSLSAQQLEKELAAQRMRAKALEHLQKTGQAIDKVDANGIVVPRKDVGKGGDNTLELIFRQSVLAKSSVGAEKEKVLKASLLTQQDSHRAATSGGGAWKEVPDVVSGRPYYWNTITNETAWEQPEGFVASAVDTLTVNSSSHVDTLPDGWVEKMHPATKQKYYFHQSSGKSSNQHPSTVSVPTAASTSAHANPQPGHGPATANSASNKRNRTEEVDPLDYTGGQVSRWITELCESYHHIRNDVDIILQGGKRGARDGAMADSTASGPLWQQR